MSFRNCKQCAKGRKDNGRQKFQREGANLDDYLLIYEGK